MLIHPSSTNLLCTIHEGKSLGIIQLAELSEEIQPYAKVIEAGPDCKRHAIGDMVLFLPDNVIYADNINGQKTVIVPESSVFATLTLDAPTTNN